MKTDLIKGRLGRLKQLGTLLIYLGLSKVPLKSWYKFILPLQFIFLLAELVMLFVACQIGYGPM